MAVVYLITWPNSLTWLDGLARPGDSITVRDLEWLPLEWLALNMRDIDQLEIYNNQPTDNPLELTAMIMHETAKHGVGYLAYLSGRPIAAFGVIQMWTGVYQIWSFGADEYSRALLHFRQKLHKTFEYLLQNGCHRLQCSNHERHLESRRFLKLLGAREEAVLSAFGKDGADYRLFVWSREAMENVISELDRAPG